MSETINTDTYEGTIRIHPGILDEISLYPDFLDSIREFICNAWDADADRVEITIKDDLLKIEDWGTGIANLKRFWDVANQHKAEIEYTPKFKRKPIGRKGLGKLSFKMVAKELEVETRTTTTAAYSVADLTTMKYLAKQRINIDEVMTHTGTQIIIRGLQVELNEEDVIKYIKENLYGLILPIASKNHPLMIFVNEKKAVLSSIKRQENSIQTKYGYIYCNLTPAKTVKIDALFRGVKVKEINPASSHPARGYFNVDWLVPTLDRSNFVDGPQKRVFFVAARDWLLRNVPSKNEDIPRDLEKTLKKILKNLNQMLKDLGKLPENLLPTSKTSRPSDLKACGVNEHESPSEETPEREDHEKHQERKRLEHKILKGKEKPLKNAFGINIRIEKRGRDQPAIIPFRDEKLIVINQDHDLIKNINKLPPAQRVLPMVNLMVRAQFQLLEKFVDLSGYDYYVDDMVAMYISKEAVDE